MSRGERRKLTLLEYVKMKTDKHMWEEIGIIEKVMDLSDDEAREFSSWFNGLPQVKGIREIQDFVSEKQKVQLFAH